MKAITFRSIIVDFLLITAGCVLYAVGITVFIEPNFIPAGGATGIATLLHHIYEHLPIGLFIILLNLPLFAVGFIKFNGKFLALTVFSTITSSILIDIFDTIMPKFLGDVFLASLSAGVLTGGGIALIMLRGATTGGTDIIAKLLNKKFRFLPIGRIMMLVDALIVIISAFFYKTYVAVLYAAVYLFTMSVVCDKILYGNSRGRLLLIITDVGERMIKEIITLNDRGVTKINAYGGYTDNEKQIIMCASKSFSVLKIMNTVKSVDSNAFVISLDANEILGNGFAEF